MKQSTKHRCISAAIAAASLLSSKTLMGAVIAGPEQDLKATAAANYTISIHSEFWKITDDITIICNSDASVAGVGYVENGGNPNEYVLTTIYGDDLDPGATSLGTGEVAGVDPVTPDFSILGGEHIHGLDGQIYNSSVSATPTYSQLAQQFPQFDLSPFSGAASGNTFYEFQTTVPASAVPEPVSLGSLIGIGGMLCLRRRRRG